ncbi:MAG: RagB/SusD family nutrient uptake outer membrane protein, partial [Tannerella sp.]|nr:RagB/SusD family nutrient uptake outer membrane protein [Tannerella sp.]
MKVNNIIRYVWGLAVSFTPVACDSFMEADPPSNMIIQEDVYNNIHNVRAAVNGLYTQNLLSNGLFYYYLPFYLTPVADDAYHTSTSYDNLRYNTYAPTTTEMAYFWTNAYQAILLSNDLIEHLPATALPEEEIRQNIGEAKYFRAYCYFVLAYLYGDAPWVTSDRILETTLQPRDPKEIIVGHIIQDLKDAEEALEGSSNPNTRVTATAASALLARNYLYHREWQNAEAKADEVIRTSGYSLDAPENVFLRTSKETLFRTSSSGSWSSYIDRVYIAQLSVNTNYLCLTDDLVASFEAGDL